MPKGDFIKYVVSNNPNKYPIDGEQGNYYYEKLDIELLESMESWVENLPVLSFIGNEDFTLKVYDTTKHWDGTLEYSTDYVTWNIWDGTEISSKNKLLALRGTGNTIITGNSSNYRFVFTGSDNLNIKCYGNIETLLDYQTVMNGEHPTMSTYCYADMFYGCTSLTQAPQLPATTLAEYCYDNMFRNCTSLTTTPELPATTLANSCYRFMFFNCKSLTKAPQLPATTLAEYCYENMFRNCTSLIQASELPATTLAEYCYENMFSGCTSLTTTPQLPATTLANSCYRTMFFNCKSLTKAPQLPATTLAGYCYFNMFYNCKSLTTTPQLPATTLAEYCYNGMFSGCINIKLSTTQTGEYQLAYRIPTTGTGTTATDALTKMFTNTGGTFTGTPEINTTYYTSNEIV